jgi:TolB-like protein/Tfp pilus assembly protein PilF
MVLPRFLTELKRRNVYRAALVYAGVGWVLLEVADVAFPRLGLPDWTVNFVLALVLLGFPLAIVFAWIFDFSPQGVVRTSPLSPGEHHHFSIARIAEFVLIGALVATVGYLYVDRLSLQKGMVEPEAAVQENPAVPNPEQYRALAVLPFADMSEAGDQAWFAEGVAEELLHALASVDELHVMARTSSFAFKDSDKTVAEIADILGVQAVLEGSIRRSGDRVRITAQLVDATSGYNLWSGSYQRELTDIFQLQDELARAIVQALRVELGVEAVEPLVAEQTKSLEAYNWFMRGRALFSWANPENVAQSIDYFEKAVEADPDYAMAWGQLAQARMTTMAFHSFEDVGPGAIAAYEKALALDPNQSDALAVKALITQILHYDYETAGKLYQRALAYGDYKAGVINYAFFYLVAIDEIPLAIRLYAEAEERDPMHAGIKNNHTMVLRFNGDAEAAVQKAREALQLNPGHEIALANLIGAYGEAGQFAAGQRLLEKASPALLERPRTILQIGLYYAARGDRERAYQIYRELADNPPSHGMIYLALLALKVGELEEAIDLMEREVEENTSLQFWIRTLFRNEESVKNHPRYLALLKRIGLDDESVAELHRKMSFD